MTTSKPTIAVPITDLMDSLFQRVADAGSVKRGTYNNADPTSWARALCYIHHIYDPWLLRDVRLVYPEAQDDTPPYATYQISVENVGWGIEVTVLLAQALGLPSYAALSDSPYAYTRGDRAFAFYVDGQTGELFLRDTKGPQDMASATKFLIDMLTVAADPDHPSSCYTSLSGKLKLDVGTTRITKTADGKMLVECDEEHEGADEEYQAQQTHHRL